MSNVNLQKPIRFLSFKLRIEPTFWSTLYEKKLNEWKLDDSYKKCLSFVSDSLFDFRRESFDIDSENEDESETDKVKQNESQKK